MKTQRLMATILAGLVSLSVNDSTLAIERGLSRVKPNPDANRIALLIGNQSYRSSPLDNPVNDAQGLADALSSVGFDVVKLENADKKSMRHAVQAFSDRLRKTQGVGLF